MHDGRVTHVSKRRCMSPRILCIYRNLPSEDLGQVRMKVELWLLQSICPVVRLLAHVVVLILAF